MQAQKLREKEIVLTAQIREVKDRFKVMWKKVKDAFDDLQQNLKRRRQEVNALIQSEEEAVSASLAGLERNRAAVKSNAGTVEKLVSSASDVALLDMLSKLATRLDNLGLQSGKAAQEGRGAGVLDVTFDQQRLNSLKGHIANLGRLTTKTRARSARSPKTGS